MSRHTALGAVVAGAVVLSAASLIGTAARAPAAVPVNARINVTLTLVSGVTRELPPAGRQSDAVEIAWRITNREGDPIGRVLQACRWVMPRQMFCAGEIQLPRGKITFAGASPSRFTAEYAVTGGTGIYGRGGVARFTAIGRSKTIMLVTFG